MGCMSHGLSRLGGSRHRFHATQSHGLPLALEVVAMSFMPHDPTVFLSPSMRTHTQQSTVSSQMLNHSNDYYCHYIAEEVADFYTLQSNKSDAEIV